MVVSPTGPLVVSPTGPWLCPQLVPVQSTSVTRVTCWWGRLSATVCPPASIQSSRPSADVSILTLALKRQFHTSEFSITLTVKTINGEFTLIIIRPGMRNAGGHRGRKVELCERHAGVQEHHPLRVRPWLRAGRP